MTSIVRSTHSVATHACTTPTNGCLPSNRFQNHSDDVHRTSKFGNLACTPQATLTAACPAPPHRQPPLRTYGVYAEMLSPATDNSKVPCTDEHAIADLGSLQKVGQVAPPACEASDMHTLMMHANPIATASQLLSRLRQAPIDDQINSSLASSMTSQTVHVPSASWLPPLSVPDSVHWSCLTATPHEHMIRPRHGEKRKLSRLRPQLDYMCTSLHSESQEQRVSHGAGHAIPDWQDGMAAGTELTQRPKRSVRACFAQVQEFDRMHSTAHGLAIGSLKIPRGNPGPGQTVLCHDDSPASLQHVDSPASSVQGQSWPYACNPEILSGTKSFDSSSVSSQQSSYFLGSQQQPLFLTTFDMPLEAPPPPGLRPFY